MNFYLINQLLPTSPNCFCALFFLFLFIFLKIRLFFFNKDMTSLGNESLIVFLFKFATVIPTIVF